jgi:hypothetical protein
MRTQVDLEWGLATAEREEEDLVLAEEAGMACRLCPRWERRCPSIYNSTWTACPHGY